MIFDDYYRDLPIMEDITILPDITGAALDSRVGILDNIFLSTIFIVVKVKVIPPIRKITDKPEAKSKSKPELNQKRKKRIWPLGLSLSTQVWC